MCQGHWLHISLSHCSFGLRLPSRGWWRVEQLVMSQRWCVVQRYTRTHSDTDYEPIRCGRASLTTCSLFMATIDSHLKVCLPSPTFITVDCPPGRMVTLIFIVESVPPLTSPLSLCVSLLVSLSLTPSYEVEINSDVDATLPM